MTASIAELLAALPREVIEAERCRRSFRAYLHWCWPLLTGVPLRENYAIGALIAVLQAVADRSVRRARIEVGPGLGKTTTLDGYCSFRLARRPSHRLIRGSHAHDLAARDSRKVRRLVESEAWQSRFAARLSADENTASNWRTVQDGRYIAVGTGGSLTGFRAHEVIVDDAMNAIDAHSKAARDATYNWFSEGLVTRLDLDPEGGDGSIVVCGQRLAVEDIHGQLAESDGAESWTVVRLPAEYDSARPCIVLDGTGNELWRDPRTVDGELIAPDTLPREKLVELRRSMGSAAFNAQLNQDPAPSGGGSIKASWWRFFRTEGKPAVSPRPRDCWTGDAIALPPLDDVVMAVDLGVKGGTQNDNTALAVIGARGADRFVLDLVARPMEFTAQKAALLALRAKWPQVKRVIIEDSANYAALKSELGSSMQGIVPVRAEGPKEARIAAMTPAIESSNVYLCDGASYVDELIAEASAWPHGRRDDRLDALQIGLAALSACDDGAQALAELRAATANLRAAFSDGPREPDPEDVAASEAERAAAAADRERRRARLDRLAAREAAGERLSRAEKTHLRMWRRRPKLDQAETGKEQAGTNPNANSEQS